MISTISDFVYIWSQELEATQKILKHLTDKSLAQAVTPQDRTLGRMAWHIVTTIGEMMGRTGLVIGGPKHDTPVPVSSKEIFKAYNESAVSLLEQVKTKWTDVSLQEEDEMYGERWKRSLTLTSLVLHQVHHRGQMTVLMRQAGLPVPGVYGPAREEWSAFGAQPPVV